MFKYYDQDIGMLSNKINKKLIHYLNSKLEKFNITTDQWLVLVKLSKQNKINQKNLAEVSSKDQSTLTRIIDILERKKFIERHPSKEDRRSIDIYITDDGLDTCKKVNPFLENIFNDILKGISYARLKIFNEVFLQIDENIDNLKHDNRD